MNDPRYWTRWNLVDGFDIYDGDKCLNEEEVVERLNSSAGTREEAMEMFDLIPKPKVEVRTLDFGGGHVTHQVCINHLHLIAREFYPDWSEEDAHQVVCNINHALGITENTVRTSRDVRDSIIRALKETSIDELQRQFQAVGGWPEDKTTVDRDAAMRIAVSAHPKCWSCAHKHYDENDHSGNIGFCVFWGTEMNIITDYCPNHSELKPPKKGDDDE